MNFKGRSPGKTLLFNQQNTTTDSIIPIKPKKSLFSIPSFTLSLSRIRSGSQSQTSSKTTTTTSTNLQLEQKRHKMNENEKDDEDDEEPEESKESKESKESFVRVHSNECDDEETQKIEFKTKPETPVIKKSCAKQISPCCDCRREIIESENRMDELEEMFSELTKTLKDTISRVFLLNERTDEMICCLNDGK